jgi:hypothetical protein
MGVALLVLIDLLLSSKMRRREARREAGLLIHEHGETAVQVIRAKLVDPAQSGKRSELRLTLWYLRSLIEARRERRHAGRRS